MPRPITRLSKGDAHCNMARRSRAGLALRGRSKLQRVYVCVASIQVHADMCACVCVHMRVSIHRGCSEKPENATAVIPSTCCQPGCRWILPGWINSPSTAPRCLRICSEPPRNPAESFSSRPQPAGHARCPFSPAPCQGTCWTRASSCSASRPGPGPPNPVLSSLLPPTIKYNPPTIKYNPLPSATLSPQLHTGAPSPLVLPSHPLVQIASRPIHLCPRCPATGADSGQTW